MLAVQIGATLAVLGITAFSAAWAAEGVFPDHEVTPFIGVPGAAIAAVGFLTAIIGAIWSI